MNLQTARMIAFVLLLAGLCVIVPVTGYHMMNDTPQGINDPANYHEQMAVAWAMGGILYLFIVGTTWAILGDRIDDKNRPLQLALF